MNLEIINKLFLELSQVTTATTGKELILLSRIKELEEKLEFKTKDVIRLFKNNQELEKQVENMKCCGNCDPNPKGTENQENVCRVNSYCFGKNLRGGYLENGINPKRTKGCLQLAEHIHNQMAHAKEGEND